MANGILLLDLKEKGNNAIRDRRGYEGGDLAARAGTSLARQHPRLAGRLPEEAKGGRTTHPPSADRVIPNPFSDTGGGPPLRSRHATCGTGAGPVSRGI